MITKEQLVCTKQQAEKLKAMRVPQRSLFAWTERCDVYGKMYVLDDNIGEGWAAFTTAELINILPPMGPWTLFKFWRKTNYEAIKVAEYLINRV